MFPGSCRQTSVRLPIRQRHGPSTTGIGQDRSRQVKTGQDSSDETWRQDTGKQSYIMFQSTVSNSNMLYSYARQRTKSYTTAIL